MSLILEALKKSERQRRLGESPSIGSPIMAVRRRRSLLPVLIGLIALGLIALWWLGRAPPTAPPSSAATTVEDADASAARPAPRNAATFDGRPLQTDAAPEKAQSSAASRLPRSKVAPDATTGLTPELREKIKSGEIVVANPQLLKPGQPATIEEPEPQPGAAGSDAAESTRPATENAVVPATPRPARPAPGSATAPAKNPSPPVAPTATAPVAAPPANTVKLIWELPLAVRRELPEIKLTMHVFAIAPENRFAIVNGERHVEGDEVEGLKLVEIRNDGVVFEREGQRFLYPRGGR